MSVSLQEQETVINMSRDLDYADIYTSDRTVMTRLDKLAEDENCPDWSCTGVQYDQKHTATKRAWFPTGHQRQNGNTRKSSWKRDG